LTPQPETDRFHKIEALLLSRGLEFTPPMRYKYFNDPMYKAIFLLILDLFEKKTDKDSLANWDPWDEFG
jgi:hypothetical protein